MNPMVSLLGPADGGLVVTVFTQRSALAQLIVWAKDSGKYRSQEAHPILAAQILMEHVPPSGPKQM